MTPRSTRRYSRSPCPEEFSVGIVDKAVVKDVTRRPHVQNTVEVVDICVRRIILKIMNKIKRD